MLHLARLLANNAFATGIVIGLLFVNSLTPAFRAVAAPASPPICHDLGQFIEEIRPFVQLQCDLHETLFSDNDEPGICFKLDKAPTTAGTYGGSTHDSKAVALDVLAAIPLDLKTGAPYSYSLNMEGTVVVGKLSGSNGGQYVLALAVETGDLTPDQGHLLFVTKILSDAEYDEWSRSARIFAGVRVVDTANMSTIPIAELNNPQSLWASPNDLSTLYCGCESGFEGGVDAECVRNAYEQYRIDMKAARNQLERCVVNVVALWSLCMTGCTAAIFTGVGALGFGLCVALCLAGEVVGFADCATAHAIEQRRIEEQLARELRRCGVIIAEE